MGVEIDVVLDIDVADEEIFSRLGGRRVCSACGASYHVKFKPPVKEGVCSLCGGELIIRNDDKPETIAERLKVYHDMTEPLKDYYAKQGKLRTVKGQGEIKDTTALVLKTLGE